ncbi:large-conductance mechanosensitive channel [Dissophora ornata]|nr:large-conductance mechanosensitive channel [Dissophora ornata]
MDRGNVVDLAVAVVIGAAFTAIVTSLVTDIITPVIALASGKNLEENFLILRYSHNETAQAMGLPATRQQAKNAGDITWNWGNFLQTVINFFIISGCVFLIVKSTFHARYEVECHRSCSKLGPDILLPIAPKVYQVGRNKKIEVTEKKCDYCLKSVPLNAVRCPNCTTWLDWDACARVKDMELAAAGSKTESPFVDPSYNRDYQAGHASLGRF